MFFCLFTGTGSRFKKSYQRCRSSAVIFLRNSCALVTNFLLYEYMTYLLQKQNPEDHLLTASGVHFTNTRFHPNISLAGHRAPIQLSRKGGIRPNLHGGTHSNSAVAELFPSLSLSFGGRIPFGGRMPVEQITFCGGCTRSGGS